MACQVDRKGSSDEISDGYAREAPEAEKHENPQWYWVVQVDYAPGMTDQAMTIINDYFAKASDAAGTDGPVMAMETSSGEYDMVYIWHMKDGIEGMNWKTSPEDVKWYAAFSELAGGEEKAREIMAKYNFCVAKTKANLGRKAW